MMYSESALAANNPGHSNTLSSPFSASTARPRKLASRSTRVPPTCAFRNFVATPGATLPTVLGPTPLRRVAMTTRTLMSQRVHLFRLTPQRVRPFRLPPIPILKSLGLRNMKK